MADFRKLALEYVLSDDADRQASITKEAAAGMCAYIYLEAREYKDRRRMLTHSGF